MSNVANYAPEVNVLSHVTGKSTERYTFKIENTDTTEKRIAIFPGTSVDKDGFNKLVKEAVDGLITETIDKVTVTPTSPGSVRDFIEYALKVPVHVSGVHMRVNNPEQFGNPVTVYDDVSPFKTSGSIVVDPAEAKNPNQSDDKLVHIETFPSPVFLSYKSAWVLSIVPGAKVTISFYVDGSFDAAEALTGSIERGAAARAYGM